MKSIGKSMWGILPRHGKNLCRGLSKNQEMSITILNNSNVVQKSIRMHGLSGFTAEMFGKAMSASTILSCQLKGEERSIVRFNAKFNHDGEAMMSPFSLQITAEGIQNGKIRGYLRAKVDDSSLSEENRDEKEILSLINESKNGQDCGFVCQGTFSVSSILYGNTRPYTSTVGISKGDVMSELDSYFKQSIQAPSCVYVDTCVDMRSGGEERCMCYA